MKQRVVKIYRMLATAVLYACCLSFISLFMVAYMNAEKYVLLDINSIGEANVELFFIVAFATPELIIRIYSYVITPENESS